VLSVRKNGTSCEVTARVHIPGQMYDWGKSEKWLDVLFDDLRNPTI